VSDELQAEHVSALMVPPGRPNEVYAVAGGRLWASADGARSWQPHDGGLPAGGVEVVGLDSADSARMWAVAAGQVFRTDDRGQRWRPAGVPLPERPVIARAVAASGHVLLIATDRGLFRSVDAGERWELLGESLPAHLEAGLLVRDPLNPGTLYAGFALTPAEELRQRSTEGGRAFARLDILSLAGGAAFLALLALGAGALVRRLARTHYRTQLDRHGSPAVGRIRRSDHVPR
jgi:hypothetical protein